MALRQASRLGDPLVNELTIGLSNPLVSPEAQYVGASEELGSYGLVSLTRPAMPTKPVSVRPRTFQSRSESVSTGGLNPFILL